VPEDSLVKQLGEARAERDILKAEIAAEREDRRRLQGELIDATNRKNEAQAERDRLRAAFDLMERFKAYPFWNNRGWMFLVTENWQSSKIIAKAEAATPLEAIEAVAAKLREQGWNESP
jgi:hypothetical protein